MPRRPDNDSLTPRLLRSAVVHVALLAAVAGYSYLQGRVSPFGENNPNSGGSFMIQPVNAIPLPTHGPVQRVANDTESEVPEPPKAKPQPKRAAPDPDAVSLKSKKEDRTRQKQAPAVATPKQPERPNQVYSENGARASAPIYQNVPGSGGAGLAPGNPFGQRFGYYADLVRQRVAQNWRTGSIPMNSAPPVVVTFDVRRDGTVTNVRVVQSSRDAQLDRSCQRAVIDASPLPPLPAGFERDTANIEFWFQLKK